MKSTQHPSKPSKQQPSFTNPERDETTVTEVAAERSPFEGVATQSLSHDSTVEEIAPVNSSQLPKPQRRSLPRVEKPEYTERFQHMQFIDCDSEVGRVIFECYHCQQGIISEYTGEPVMGEYKGRPSVVLAKVKCPNCEQTAIRLQAHEVLSTTAIASPWA